MASVSMKEFLAAQQRFAEREKAKGGEHISMEEFRKIIQEQAKSTKVLEEQKKISVDSKVILEKSKSVQDEELAVLTKTEENSDDFNEELEKVSKESLKIQNEQLKLSKKQHKETLKQSEKLEELAKNTAPDRAKRITENALEMPTFKTIGDRFDDFKDGIKNLFTLRGFLDKTGFVKKGTGGILDTALARRDAKLQHQEDRIKTSGGAIKDTPANREMLGKEFENQQTSLKKIKKNEAEISRLKKLGYGEENLKKAGLLEKRQQLAFEAEKYNENLASEEQKEKRKKSSAKATSAKEPRSVLTEKTPGEQTKKEPSAVKEPTSAKEPRSVLTEKTPGEQTKKEPSAVKEPIVSEKEHRSVFAEKSSHILEKTTSEKVSPDSYEATLEQNREIQKQTDLLQKIEENTRGEGKGSAGQKNKAKQDAEGKASSSFGDKFGKLGDTLGKMGGAAKTLLAFSGALWVTSKAFENFAELDWGGILKGVAAMTGLALVTKLLDKEGGPKTLLALGASLWVVSQAFENFAELNWGGIAKGLVALGGLTLAAKALSTISGDMMKGALGLGVLAAAVWGISKALENFTKISWEDMAKAAVTIGALAAGAMLIGGAAAPILLGAAALGALGAAIWVVGEGIQVVGEGFDKFVGSFERLGEIDGSNLIKVGAGLAAVGAGIAVFATGNAAAGLANLVSGFLNLITPGKTPIEQLMELAKVGPELEKAGTGVKALAEGLKELSGLDKASIEALAKLPADKLAALGTAAGNALSGKQAADSRKQTTTNSGKQTSNEVQPQSDSSSAQPRSAARTSSDEYKNIAGQRYVPGQPLTNEQAKAVELSMSMGNKPSDDVLKSYQMYKQKAAAAAPESSAPGVANTVYNKSAENAGNVQQAPSAPVIVNAPSTVNNNMSKQDVSIQQPIRNIDRGFGDYLKRNQVFI